MKQRHFQTGESRALLSVQHVCTMQMLEEAPQFDGTGQKEEAQIYSRNRKNEKGKGRTMQNVSLSIQPGAWVHAQAGAAQSKSDNHEPGF